MDKFHCSRAITWRYQRISFWLPRTKANSASNL